VTYQLKFATPKGGRNMTRFLSLAMVTAVLAGASCAQAQTRQENGKICHTEQQCHWENFKKICTYVKVCR
jgi:hypothetical protein